MRSVTALSLGFISPFRAVILIAHLKHTKQNPTKIKVKVDKSIIRVGKKFKDIYF